MEIDMVTTKALKSHLAITIVQEYPNLNGCRPYLKTNNMLSREVFGEIVTLSPGTT